MVRKINIVEKMLVDFLKIGICGEKINDRFKDNLTVENLESLYKFAKKHDLAHIVADVLYKNKLMPDCEIASEYKNYLMMSLFRYQQIAYELKRICDLFEENEIPHLPLKGAYIRQFYPEPWLRTSCDIDILVKKEDLQKVADLVVNKLNFSEYQKHDHDWGFFTENNLLIEFHFDLMERDHLSKERISHSWDKKYLESVWERTVLVQDKKFEYEMTDEMFYYFHIAHMAKHFKIGGCGIRTILDMWLLNNHMKYDRSNVEKMLNDSGLLDFERCVKQLSDVWFLGYESNELIEEVGDFILSAGIYGSFENNMAVRITKKGNRFKYMLLRVFAPYEILVKRFPVLKKHKWLIPLCHVSRWIQIGLGGNLKNGFAELKTNNSLSDEKINDVKRLINILGL